MRSKLATLPTLSSQRRKCETVSHVDVSRNQSNLVKITRSQSSDALPDKKLISINYGNSQMKSLQELQSHINKMYSYEKKFKHRDHNWPENGKNRQLKLMKI